MIRINNANVALEILKAALVDEIKTGRITIEQVEAHLRRRNGNRNGGAGTKGLYRNRRSPLPDLRRPHVVVKW